MKPQAAHPSISSADQRAISCIKLKWWSQCLEARWSSHTHTHTAATSVRRMNIGCLINAFYKMLSAPRSSRIKAVATTSARPALLCLLGTLERSPALFSINTSVRLDPQNNKCHIFGRYPETHRVNCKDYCGLGGGSVGGGGGRLQAPPLQRSTYRRCAQTAQPQDFHIQPIILPEDCGRMGMAGMKVRLGAAENWCE